MSVERMPEPEEQKNGQRMIEEPGMAEKPAAESAAPAQESAEVKARQARPADPKDADDVETRKLPGREEADAAVLEESKIQTRRSFLVAGAALVVGGGGLYGYLNLEPETEAQPNLLRKIFQINQKLSQTIDRDAELTPTYPLGRAETLRVNGIVGLKKDLQMHSYRLQMVGVRAAAARPGYVQDVTAWEYTYMAPPKNEDQGHDSKTAPKPPAPGSTVGGAAPAGADQASKTNPKNTTAQKMGPGPKMQQADANPAMANQDKDENEGEDDNKLGRKPRGQDEAGESDSTLPAHTPGLLLTIDALKGFPRQELVTQFKCIEGWSQIVHWAGIRLADFLEAYPPELIDGKEPRYVYMETPDGDYYVGYDLKVCRHPQTLLVTEMMGQPLTQNHGAPVRIHMPIKYGYKQIKRIGLISYTNERPDDYWTKLGYDWYAGL